MQSADIGEKAANILPSQATAELDLRTTPGADPTMLADLIEKHIRSKGYYLTKEPPTDEERAAHDKIASFVVARGSAAAFTPFDSAVGVWAQASLEKSFAKDRQAAKIVRHSHDGRQRADRQTRQRARSALRHHPAGQFGQQPAQLRREHPARPLPRGNPGFYGPAQRTILTVAGASRWRTLA
jgi:hypothetical protein